MKISRPTFLSQNMKSRMLWWRWPLLVGGLLLTGASGTYLIVPPTTSTNVLKVNASGLAADSTTGAMPSVVGLSFKTAQLVFADANLGDIKVDTKEEPAAGAPGRVLSQSPVVGAATSSNISLTISSPIAMPKVQNTDYKAAQSKLEELGAVVQLIQVIKPGSMAGKVLKSDPQDGATLPAVVKLYVADPGEAVSLADVASKDAANCTNTGETDLGGTTVTDGIDCSIQKSEPSFVEYAVEGNALTFEFLAGYDTGAGRGAGTIRVLGDGKELKVVDIASGTSKATVDIAKVSVLRIEVTGSSEDEANLARLVLGNAKLLGSPEGVATIAGGN